MSAILQFDSITFSYPGRPKSLDSLSFQIERGKKVAVVGPNGAGKTTLLLMCNGTLVPDSGSVLLNGGPVSYDKSGLRELRSKVGLVFQNSDSQVFAPSVFADVAFGPLNLHLSEEEINERVSDAIFAVGLSGYEKRVPHHLSGGERKRVAIAGILAMKPDILVADEPTSSLDPATSAEIMDLLDELHEEGTTILLSTHDVELAYSWADEIILLADGRILRQATPEEVFSDTELMNQARLTSPVLLTLYQELVKLGVLKDAVPPKGIPEMTRLIEGSFDTNPGTIYTVDTDSIDEAFLSEILQTHKSRRIGAMGTRSKKFLYNAGVSPEFTYGVVDKALLAAMIGEDTIIFTCGGMVERVDLRVSMFEEASAASIQVVKLYPNTANH